MSPPPPRPRPTPHALAGQRFPFLPVPAAQRLPRAGPRKVTRRDPNPNPNPNLNPNPDPDPDRDPTSKPQPPPLSQA